MSNLLHSKLGWPLGSIGFPQRRSGWPRAWRIAQPLLPLV